MFSRGSKNLAGQGALTRAVLRTTAKQLCAFGRFQIHQHHREVGGTDAADAAGLAKTCRTNPPQLFFGFHAQLGNGGKIKVRRNDACLPCAESARPARPGVHIAGVFRFQNDLFNDIAGKLRQQRQPRHKFLPARFGSFEPGFERVSLVLVSLQKIVQVSRSLLPSSADGPNPRR